MAIPKKLHVTWKNKNILDSNSSLVTNGIKNFLKLNPEWILEISDDIDVENYLIENMKENYSLVINSNIVSKTDIWRLYKIFNEGGIYLDIDRYCNVVLTQVIPDNVKLVLPTCRKYDFSQDIMISEPNNILFKNAIDMNIHRRQLGYNHTYFLGAQTYMHAITYTFFGKSIDSNPGEKIFTKIVTEIGKNKDILVFEENLPYETFLYRGERIDEDWETSKKQLYKEYNLKHWTGKW